MANRNRKVFTVDDLYLSDQQEMIDYKTGNLKDFNYHWGQRKLLLGKIEALTMYWDPATQPELLIVYAGAAPFTYWSALRELFAIPGTKVTWHLYDPRKIEVPEGLADFVVFNQYFTDEDAEKYRGKNVFFFSDIRTVGGPQMIRKSYEKYGVAYSNPEAPLPLPTADMELASHAKREANLEVESAVWNDMKMQQGWVEIIQPAHAFLKFRLPYVYPYSPNEMLNVEYLAGEVLFQQWAGGKSSETRLHPVKNEQGFYYRKNWDSKEYESWLAYFNNYTRTFDRYFNVLHPDDLTKCKVDPPELFDDWDSMAETFILQQYCRRLGYPEDQIAETVPKISRFLTEKLDYDGKGRTLESIRQRTEIRFGK